MLPPVKKKKKKKKQSHLKTFVINSFAHNGDSKSINIKNYNIMTKNCK